MLPHLFHKNNRSTLKLLSLAASIVFSPLGASFAGAQNTIIIDAYQSGISDQWNEKEFNGHTQYTIAIKDNQTSIMAISSSSASGLFYKIDYAPGTYPILEWSWQIQNVLQAGDARYKKGDDYAARTYVVFPDIFFWRTKSLNYIWANRLPKGEFCTSAYSPNSIMIAVQSGNQKAGRWLTEQRNIVEDYKQAFGELPPDVGAIAIMTDTDDTREQAKAWYGPIKIKTQFIAQPTTP